LEQACNLTLQLIHSPAESFTQSVTAFAEKAVVLKTLLLLEQCLSDEFITHALTLLTYSMEQSPS
jgi:hypothetical protein